MLTEEGLLHVPGLMSRWVRLASGAKAHYVTSGETGPAVILLHGGIIGSSGTAGWRFTAPFLGANGFRVYCPDMPGFGLSDIANEEHWPTGFGSFVDFIHEFATALCLDEFHLSGQSLGCMNTVNYVVAHPDRVKSYVLIAGSIGDLFPVAEQERIGTSAPIHPFDGTEESMRRSMEAIIYRGEAISDDLVRMRTMSANRNRPVYQQWLKKAMAEVMSDDPDPNIGARLRTKGRFDLMTTPGIYLWGKQDVRNPVEQAYPQEDLLPNVQFFYPDGTGHQGQTDNPDLFNQVYLEFFRDGKISWETAQRAGISERRAPDPRLVAVPSSVTV